MDHENIIHTYHSFIDVSPPKYFKQKQYALVMERGTNTLDKYLNEYGNHLSTAEKLSIILGIASGIDELQYHRVFHNDLKVCIR